MISTIRFVLLTATRDRLFLSLFVILAATFAISAYIGGAAVAETRQASLVYAAGSARIFLALGLAVFVAFNIERLYETREIEALLSRPIARESFLLSYWMAVGLVALLIAAPVIGFVFAFHLSIVGAAWWSITVICECFIVAAFAIFCGMTFEKAIPTIFATGGFYALARLIGFFLGIAEGSKHTGVNEIANPLMEYLGYFLPRLDLAGQSQWLVYGVDASSTVVLVVCQCAVYTALLLTAAMFDFRRRLF